MGVPIDGTRTFRGIPYAKPPIGPLRFAAPEPAEPWDSPLAADAFGPDCPQPRFATGATGEQSEDCLTLNVFAPPAEPGARLPVMVFIFGGVFIVGGSSQYTEANTLSKAGNVVVVTINHRLGALGFLAHPELDAALGRPSGNMALRDQQLALTWVQRNIAAFGGDPENVTLFGQSSGGGSACHHMFARGSEGLVQRYILESGSCLGSVQGHEEALQLGTELVTELCGANASVASCLADADVEELLAFRGDRGLFGTGWQIHVDGPGGLLVDHPAKLLEAGAFAAGELLLGTNQDEWGLFYALGIEERGDTLASLDDYIDSTFGGAAHDVKALYNAASDVEAKAAFGKLMADVIFRCPVRRLARELSQRGHATHLYHFELPPAYHGLELDYVFGMDLLSGVLGLERDESLEDTIQAYWSRFAAAGDPNGGELPHWPTYNTEDDTHLVLGAMVRTASGLAHERCDFWDNAAR